VSDPALLRVRTGRKVTMDITGRTALVTGGQRGIGRAIAEELLRRGAMKVFVTARDTVMPIDPRISPLTLDVTDPASVSRLAEVGREVSIVVNNAGVDRFADLLSGDVDAMREEFDVNVFGLIAVTRVMAPVLARHGGGAFVNMLSALSWASVGDAYSASKSAAWSASNGFRALLADAGTSVTSVHLGYADTDMTAHLDVPKIQPSDVAVLALDGLERGDSEVLVDDITRHVRGLLAGDPAQLGILV
jgi:NAD(P)-dependent dehydrogenase (short-subunit alcohol dehydrogenase family)